ncbi:MAG: ribonuclease III [Candidatus Velthaea sp.]
MRALLKLSGAPDVDPALVDGAFVHESAARESVGASNERLEFFGDAILGFVTARFLCARYPHESEGDLTRRKNALVNGDACAYTARRLGFGELMTLGHGMRNAGGVENSSILSDAFEAYIAALFAATGLETVAAFIENQHLQRLDRAELVEADPKTALQEFAQGRLGLMPAYFERAEGPPHDRRFTSQVRVGDEVLGEGIGPTKKGAQQSAAAMALIALRRRTPPEAPPEPASNRGDGRVIAFRARRKAKLTPKAPG